MAGHGCRRRAVWPVRLFCGRVAILTGVALAKTIGAGAMLKWPNDVLLGGRKCAGILIDSDLDGSRINWLVVGIGVNTAQAPEIGGALPAGREAFRARLLSAVADYYDRWRRAGFAQIRQEWIEASYPRGTMLNVGAFEDLDEFGSLVVRDKDNRRRTVPAGDIYLRGRDYAAGY